ncbi:MAG: hypothetical protein H0X24_13745 [Ktedonobacterales bacterium]|nr:hypothetical protein [Ktedonobacterales bacterium]
MAAISSASIASVPSSDAPRRSLGQGRYIITDALHAGGGRALLVGRPTGMNQSVLIERISGLSQAALARAMRQADAVLELAHPNLARAIDCFVEEAALHVVMVAGPGALLSDPRGIVNEGEAVAMGTQLCNALGYLTLRGISPALSIDPSTVYLTTAGRVKLTNLAALLGVRLPRRSPRLPAQAQSPVFRIGALMHHVLTGWPRRSLQTAPALATLRPDLSSACCATISQALAPVDGWASPADLRYALLQIPD